MSGIQGLPLAERFWNAVTPAAWDECWLWALSLNDAGYGQFAIDHRPHRAHRIAYELMVGEIPEGLVLDHLCRVRSCVNPLHLDPVTHAVNIARGVRKPVIPKTHCPSAHEYTPENTRITRAGHRSCRTCERRLCLAAYYRRSGRFAEAEAVTGERIYLPRTSNAIGDTA